MMEAARISETMVNFYHVIWCNNLEDSHFQEKHSHKMEITLARKCNKGKLDIIMRIY
jgi:hypothetical protein